MNHTCSGPRALMTFLICCACALCAGAAGVVTPLAQQYGETWHTLSVPVTLRVESPVSLKVSGQMTMERGQWTAVSARVIGMEVAWLDVDNKDVTAVDKWHKRYISQSIGRFLADFPVTISDLQHLLMGRMFVVGQPAPTDDNLMVEVADSAIYLNPCQPVGPVDYAFQLESPQGSLSALIAAQEGHYPVVVTYDPPVQTPYGPVSPKLSIFAILGKLRIEASLTFNYSKAKWDKDVRRPRLPSSGYQEVSPEQLLRQLGANGL